jgi:hypothetical protein
VDTYLLSVSLVRVRTITPAPRAFGLTISAPTGTWLERGGEDEWSPDRCARSDTAARRLDAVATAQR